MNSLKFPGSGLLSAFFNFGTPTHNSKKGREPTQGVYNQNQGNPGFYNQSPEAAADDNEICTESGESDSERQFESASNGSDSATQHLRYSEEGSPPPAAGCWEALEESDTRIRVGNVYVEQPTRSNKIKNQSITRIFDTILLQNADHPEALDDITSILINRAACPSIETHLHGEGQMNDVRIQKWLKKANLYWDPVKNTLRHNGVPKKQYPEGLNENEKERYNFLISKSIEKIRHLEDERYSRLSQQSLKYMSEAEVNQHKKVMTESSEFVKMIEKKIQERSLVQLIDQLPDFIETIPPTEKENYTRIIQNSISRIPSEKLTLKHIRKYFCVEIEPPKPEIGLQFSFEEDISIADSSEKKFHRVFDPRDLIPLEEQWYSALKAAEANNTLYTEYGTGVYDIPVPQSIKNRVESLLFCSSNKEMFRAEINTFIQELSTKKLKDFLSIDEQAKLKTKVEKRLKEDCHAEYYENLLEMSYLEAAHKHLLCAFNRAERLVKERIQKKMERAARLGKTRKFGQDFLDPKSPLTLKFIFEIMRHYTIGEYFIYALIASSFYAHEDNKWICGCTVVGPENTKNSKRYFSHQVKIMAILKEKYGINIAYHALEFDHEGFERAKLEYNKHLLELIAIAGRISHVTKIMEVNDFATIVSKLKNKAIEIMPTVGSFTTNISIEEMPFKGLSKLGLPVILGSDDPGIVYEKNDGRAIFPTIRSEYIKAMKTFNLSFSTFKTLLRDALEYSFLPGESLYNITIKKSSEKNERVHKIKPELKFNRKELRDLNCEDLEEFNKFILSNAALSPKQQKQLQLEVALYQLEKTMKEDDLEYFDKKGYYKPDFSDSDNSDMEELR